MHVTRTWKLYIQEFKIEAIKLISSHLWMNLLMDFRKLYLPIRKKTQKQWKMLKNKKKTRKEGKLVV
jgi:hypothetical protein